MRDTSTRANSKRTLSAGVEAAREGTSDEWEVWILRFNLVRKLSARFNFFIEQGENSMNRKGTISGSDVCSEEERKIVFMREKRIKVFMQMELDNCRNDLVWLIRCHNCAADICSEEENPPRPLLIPPDYIDNFQRRSGKTMNGILPPTLNIFIKMYY